MARSRPRFRPMTRLAGPIALVAILAACQVPGTAPVSGPSGMVPGEVIVRFQPDSTDAQRDALRKQYGVTRVEPLINGIERWTVPGDAWQTREALKTAPGVRYAEPNYTRHAQAFSPSELQNGATYQYFANASDLQNNNATTGTVNQWYMGTDRGIGIQAAWQYLDQKQPGVVPGTGVVVAIVDSGVDINHPDLKDRIATDEHGTPIFVDEVGIDDPIGGGHYTGTDGNGHGTHVAGLVAASANSRGTVGVAPGATILPVKVMRADGGGDDFAIARGLIEAASRSADVINLSVGGSDPSQLLADALAYDMAHGSTVVIAAGNGYGSVYYPGACQGVVCVGATAGTIGSPNVIPAYSNRGPELTIVAPGGAGVGSDTDSGLLSTLPTYPYYLSSHYAKPLDYGIEVGTSMATPVVSGVAALVIADAKRLGVRLTPDQVRARLIATARSLDGSPFNNLWGYGLVDPLRALTFNGTGGSL